jgi:hypothetical protein
MLIDLTDLTGSNFDWLSPAGSLGGSPSKTPECRLGEIVTLTQRLFGGSCKVTVESDPEIEGLKSLVFNAKTSLEVQEIVAQCRSWHREVRRLVRDPHHLRLTIDVQR